MIGVSFHPSNNELIRTNTLTKSAIVQIDAAPFRHWYETHYGTSVGKQKKADATAAAAAADKTQSKHVAAKMAKRAKSAKLEQPIEQQISQGRLYACVSSRPGQCGRVDGYILEGEELAHYVRQMKKK